MGCFASCIGPKEKSWLTCKLLPTLHLYINFPSSCKDLNYEPPPKACRPRIKDFVLLKKTLLHTQTGKREIQSHLTRQCCHLLSVGWFAMEEDGKGTWSSDCEQDFLELLLHRFHCWQLSGISEKIWGMIFSVDRWPTSSSVVSESP